MNSQRIKQKLTLENVGSFLAKLAEKSGDVYWLSSPDFARIQYISPAYDKIWGRSRQTLYDEPEQWITYLHPEDAKDHHPIHNMRERVTQLGERARYTENYRIVRPSGEVRWIIDRGFPIMDNNGNCLGVTGVAVDITIEKQTEQLKIAKEKAEKKAKYLNIAAGTIAHDLRSPLASIWLSMGGIEKWLPQIIEGYKIAAEHQLIKPIPQNKLEALTHTIVRNKREIDFANSYIDLILSNLKYENIDTSSYQPYSMMKILHYSLDTYPYLSDERKLIRMDISSDFAFWGNDFYLKNIINNLLKNSFYFIKAARRGKIFIWTEQTEEFNVLLFKDTAKGASPEVLQQMFDGYYSTREGGTGLGLAFCKSIMLSFGGDINVSSVENEYIQFSLNFPILSECNNTLVNNEFCSSEDLPIDYSS